MRYLPNGKHKKITKEILLVNKPRAHLTSASNAMLQNKVLLCQYEAQQVVTDHGDAVDGKRDILAFDCLL